MSVTPKDLRAATSSVTSGVMTGSCVVAAAVSDGPVSLGYSAIGCVLVLCTYMLARGIGRG